MDRQLNRQIQELTSADILGIFKKMKEEEERLSTELRWQLGVLIMGEIGNGKISG